MADLLLDTTYLLPLFGIRVNLPGFRTYFPRLLNRYRVLYSPLSLVEAKWTVLRISKERPRERKEILRRFRKGLDVLYRDRRLSQTELTNPHIEEVADALLEAGVPDYFDRMIYATAVHYNAILMTENGRLLRISKEKLPRPPEVVTWEAAVRSLRARRKA